MIIESDLEEAGVKASCSYAREHLEVEFDENLVNEKKIYEVVKNAGYDLT